MLLDGCKLCHALSRGEEDDAWIYFLGSGTAGWSCILLNIVIPSYYFFVCQILTLIHTIGANSISFFLATNYYLVESEI